MPSRGITILRRIAAPTLLVVASLPLGACSNVKEQRAPIQPVELRGDEAVVAQAVAILEPRARQMEAVRFLEATCVRQETVAGSDLRFVAEGPLMVRREPATIVFKPRGSSARQILETESERLVLDPKREHATRWTYDRNGRGVMGVAALMLDIDTLARGFFVESVGAVPGNLELTRVVFVPAPGLDLPGIERLEIIFDQIHSVPRGLRVVSPAGGILVYELLRTTVDPPWSNPDIHFKLAIPPSYSVANEST